MNGWRLSYEGFDPAEEPLREALCTLGNGRFATRGANEEAAADETHYPGTYLAGGYDRLRTKIAGRLVENEDLVNLPNWLTLSFRPAEGDWLNLLAFDIVRYRQELDLKSGTLERELVVRDRDGRETEIISRRLVHMSRPHVAALQWTLRPLNWSGRIEVRSALDGQVINAGVERYRQLNSDHLVPLDARATATDSVLLLVETKQSRLRIAQAARTRLFADGGEVEVERTGRSGPGYIEELLRLHVCEGETLRIEKILALCEGRDRAISEPATAAENAVQGAPDFDELLGEHELAWAHLWRRCDLSVEGNDRVQMALRLHIFHLLQTVSPNTIDLDAGVGARGLHGEAYRGHVFWDELFVLPFLNHRIPEITRALLRYRQRRLPAARRLAREEGFRGAMYPWQSGSSGREETQTLHLNPKSGRWIPDNSHLQRHSNAAISHNVWRYFQATGDSEFLSWYGAEMLLEIARFWSSIAEFDPAKERYVIRGVVGPDEFHDRYPGSKRPGIDNNAYTNVMAAWAIAKALDALGRIESERRREICENLALTEEETSHWNEVSRKLFVPFHDGMISQFENYEKLQELDWQAYRDKYGDIHRLDRILDAEGDSINHYKASKQADVLMLFYLFSSEELHEMLQRLGYEFDPGTIIPTIDYYLNRTSHGSTLSRVVHSWVLARADRTRSWTLLSEALESDISDIQGGTTTEGIHLGAMAGTVDLVQRGHTGLEMIDNVLRLNPCVPDELKRMKLRIRFRGYWLDLTVEGEQMILSAPDGWADPPQLMLGDTVRPFEAPHRLVVPMQREEAGWHLATS